LIYRVLVQMLTIWNFFQLIVPETKLDRAISWFIFGKCGKIRFLFIIIADIKKHLHNGLSFLATKQDCAYKCIGDDVLI